MTPTDWRNLPLGFPPLSREGAAEVAERVRAYEEARPPTRQHARLKGTAAWEPWLLADSEAMIHLRSWKNGFLAQATWREPELEQRTAWGPTIAAALADLAGKLEGISTDGS